MKRYDLFEDLSSSQTLFQLFLSKLDILQATVLLQKNLENAKASLEVLVADLQFLRDQVTITQVIFCHMFQMPFFGQNL